jgi:Family of unknown function (DUF6064)
MDTPFGTHEFLAVFAAYNQSVWPMQIALYLLAGLAVLLARRDTRPSDRLISVILAFLWVWMGLIYHVAFFTVINPAAYAFGALFVLQALLFLWYGAVRGTLAFRLRASVAGVLGGILVAYALVVYPLLVAGAGHAYPATPTFGLPCPTTIFTFGLLLWASGRVAPSLLIVPALWSVIGTGAAVSLGIKQDYGLLAAGVVASLVILLRNRKRQATTRAALLRATEPAPPPSPAPTRGGRNAARI